MRRNVVNSQTFFIHLPFSFLHFSTLFSLLFWYPYQQLLFMIHTGCTMLKKKKELVFCFLNITRFAVHTTSPLSLGLLFGELYVRNRELIFCICRVFSAKGTRCQACGVTSLQITATRTRQTTKP